MQVYCHHCVRDFSEDAIYCSQCGRKLHSQKIEQVIENEIWTEEHNEEAASYELVSVRNEDQYVAIAGDIITENQNIEPSKKLWLIPISLFCLALIVTASMFYYFQYEKSVNENVLRLQSEAKTAALSGEYKKALGLLEEAIDARPAFTPLKADQDIIQHAVKLKKITDEVEKQLQTGKIADAEEGINVLKSEFSGHKEPIYEKLREKLDALQMKLKLQQLNIKMDSLVTIEEYAEILNVVNGLFGAEADKLKEQVVAIIREMTVEEVEVLLKKKNFTNAMAVVEKSLLLVKGDKELMALAQRVEDLQERYEKAEQQRIEQAMKQAAEEDLINQTAAVEVVGTEQILDEFGDLTIVGTMKNVATRPIYSVKVEFTVQSKEGEVLGKGTASATPNYIEPGEQMSYTATVYGVYTEDTVVVVDHTTWYLD